MSHEVIADSLCWYAVHTKPRQEDRAESNLRAWGIETFAPKWKERRRNQFTGKPLYITRPLFPGYIFARFEASTLLHKICFTRGVHTIVSFSGVPVPIDDRIITIIKTRRDDDGFIEIGDKCRPGDQVVITDGPLKDFTGVFEQELTESERVAVLLNSISYQARVVIEKASIRKAG